MTLTLKRNLWLPKDDPGAVIDTTDGSPDGVGTRSLKIPIFLIPDTSKKALFRTQIVGSEQETSAISGWLKVERTEGIVSPILGIRVQENFDGYLFQVNDSGTSVKTATLEYRGDTNLGIRRIRFDIDDYFTENGWSKFRAFSEDFAGFVRTRVEILKSRGPDVWAILLDVLDESSSLDLLSETGSWAFGAKTESNISGNIVKVDTLSIDDNPTVPSHPLNPIFTQGFEDISSLDDFTFFRSEGHYSYSIVPGSQPTGVGSNVLKVDPGILNGAEDMQFPVYRGSDKTVELWLRKYNKILGSPWSGFTDLYPKMLDPVNSFGVGVRISWPLWTSTGNITARLFRKAPQFGFSFLNSETIIGALDENIFNGFRISSEDTDNSFNDVRLLFEVYDVDEADFITLFDLIEHEGNFDDGFFGNEQGVPVITFSKNNAGSPSLPLQGLAYEVDDLKISDF